MGLASLPPWSESQLPIPACASVCKAAEQCQSLSQCLSHTQKHRATPKHTQRHAVATMGPRWSPQAVASVTGALDVPRTCTEACCLGHPRGAQAEADSSGSGVGHTLTSWASVSLSVKWDSHSLLSPRVGRMK